MISLFRKSTAAGQYETMIQMAERMTTKTTTTTTPHSRQAAQCWAHLNTSAVKARMLPGTILEKRCRLNCFINHGVKPQLEGRGALVLRLET